ncbi:methyltransferase domain-containing protein [Patescibacteria group bacterium]|nr:methyltransferase domain-containing protein [Patescibacteria group bacterium]
MGKEEDQINPKDKPQNEEVFLKNQLVDQLVEKGQIRSKKIEHAFRKVPRHLFLPNVDLQEAYADGSIITKKIGIEPISSSTAPSLMASMLEILHLEEGMKVLEVGTGTGYNAALIAEIVGDEKRVFSVDIDIETIQEAQQNLVKVGYKDIVIKCVDGAKGLQEYSPYDRIIVSCSVSNIPRLLVEQLKEGGVIVLPIWINGTQITPALEKQKDGILVSLSTTIGGFMELRSKTYQETLASLSKKRQEKGLLICSEHLELFEKRKLELLLKSSSQEKALPSDSILPPKGSNFFIFLALNERKSVELFLEDEVDKFGFGESAAGIVDLEKNSACLISKDNRLFVYGNPGAYKRVVSLAEKWESLKKPGVERLQVFVYMGDQAPQLKRNDILFPEKSPLLVVRILES